MDKHTENVLSLLDSKVKDLTIRVGTISVEIYIGIIGNKTIPLEKRWSIFSKYPSYLFKQKSSILHIESLEKLGYKIGYEEDIHAERHQVIDIPGVIDDFFFDTEHNQSDIDTIKEEILSKGYRTFIYDW
jgi:hypothetical protein